MEMDPWRILVVVVIAGAALSGAVIGLAATHGGDGGGPSTAETPIDRHTTPPPEFEEAKPLMADLHRRTSQYHDDVRVFIYANGSLAMEYDTTARSESELRSEVNQIAVMYAEIVNGSYEPRTLSIVVDEVEYVVPRTTLDDYVDGRINRDAFLETIGVKSIERRGD